MMSTSLIPLQSPNHNIIITILGFVFSLVFKYFNSKPQLPIYELKDLNPKPTEDPLILNELNSRIAELEESNRRLRAILSNSY